MTSATATSSAPEKILMVAVPRTDSEVVQFEADLTASLHIDRPVDGDAP